MTAPGSILVVYYSLSGNTERAAKDIAARLGADLEQIRERANRRGLFGYLRAGFDSLRERHAQLDGMARSAHEHALTIVGTPVWAGKMTPAVRTYLKWVRGRINDVAFFTTSGGTHGSKLVPGMQRLVDRQAVASVAFDQRELRDSAAYQAKLGAFVAAVTARQSSLDSPAPDERARG